MRRHRYVVMVFAAGMLTTPTLVAQSASSELPRATDAPRVRVTGHIGVIYLHQPAFSYTRGTTDPRVFTEQETDGGGVAFGGGVDVIDERWWGGVVVQGVVPVFDNSSSVIVSMHAGRAWKRLLGGTVRLGAGPVLVRSSRRERGLFSGLCFSDCTPVRYPPDLTTAGVGLLLSTEWRPWAGIGVGLEGQLATGAQRFANGRLRLSLGT
jgi:hypothetical protein